MDLDKEALIVKIQSQIKSIRGATLKNYKLESGTLREGHEKDRVGWQDFSVIKHTFCQV